jgi:uncharacterized protein YjbI with pentapeptide repeats
VREAETLPGRGGFGPDGDATGSGEVRVRRSRRDRSALIAGVAAAARLEALRLTAALQRGDEDAVLVATVQLRAAADSARAFAGDDSAPGLAGVLDYVDRLLLPAERTRVAADRAQRLLAELAKAQAGRATIDATNALLAGLDLDDLPLSRMLLERSTLSHVSACGAQLDGASLRQSKMSYSLLCSAWMDCALFDEAVVTDCNLSGANLPRTSWRGAQIVRAVGRGVNLFGARIGGATFVECDLRRADFEVETNLDAAGAVFLRCDLRGSHWRGRRLAGVSFVDCKLAGVDGAPDLEGATLTRPDLSAAADGTWIGSADDVARVWGTAGGAQGAR